MLPVNSNITSKACGEAIGSNCVEWTGGQLCSADLCKGNTTLTDVITAMDNKICGNTESTAPCYTGNWISFLSTIPASGSGSGFSWITSDFGFAGAYNTPEYRWTKDGDLSVRGGFRVTVTPSVQRAFIDIPMGNISPSCFPANWNKDQSILVSMDEGVSNDHIYVIHAELILQYPSGNLVLELSYANVTNSTMAFDIDFGGTRFNLA